MIIFSILLIFKIEYNNDNVLQSLEEYGKNKISHIVFKILAGIFHEGIITSILDFQTINLFNPNHIFVCYEISKIAYVLEDNLFIFIP